MEGNTPKKLIRMVIKMDLKLLFGEDLYNQLMAKVGDNKIAIVSDGNWIPKEKFDTVNNDNKELKTQLKDRDTQLVDLGKKAKGNEDLVAQIETLKEANKTTAIEYQSKLDKQAFDFALEKAISAAQAKNPKAVKALLDLEKVKLDGDKLIGFDDQLTALKTSDGYLFGEEPTLSGRKPNENNKPPANATKNPFSKEYFNLTEQARLFKEDPDLYKQLKALA